MSQLHSSVYDRNSFFTELDDRFVFCFCFFLMLEEHFLKVLCCLQGTSYRQDPFLSLILLLSLLKFWTSKTMNQALICTICHFLWYKYDITDHVAKKSVVVDHLIEHFHQTYNRHK